MNLFGLDEEQVRTESLRLEAETGFDSLDTVERVYASVDDDGRFDCPFPGCRTKTRKALRMWHHVHFVHTPHSFGASFKAWAVRVVAATPNTQLQHDEQRAVGLRPLQEVPRCDPAVFCVRRHPNMNAKQVTIWAVSEPFGSDPVEVESIEGVKTAKQVRISRADSNRAFRYRTNIPIEACHFTREEAIDDARRRYELAAQNATRELAKAQRRLAEVEALAGSGGTP